MTENQQYLVDHLTGCIDSSFSQFRANSETLEAWEEMRADLSEYWVQLNALVAALEPDD